MAAGGGELRQDQLEDLGLVAESQDLRVAQEQHLHFREVAEDARLRALVSEAPVHERELREAARAEEAMARHRDDVASEIAKLERSQDELLDEMLAARDRS